MTTDTQHRVTIAAIIPLYNGSRFVERSLRSVLTQTRPADEIIVIDDGSTDDGIEVARRVAAGDNRALFLTKSNGGQSAARNFAAAQAKSSHLAFLDQDDWWYPEHLQRLERPFLETHPRPLGWVYSDLDEYDGSGRMVAHRMLSHMKAEHPKRTLGSCLAQDMYVLPSAALLDKVAFHSVNGFDEQLSGYEDDDLFLRLFRAGYDNVFIPRALSAWRIHTGSSSYSARMAESANLYAGKLLAEFPDELARNRHFSRDLIAPRFLRGSVANLISAAWQRNERGMRAALAGIDRCRPHLASRGRLKLAMLRPLMGSAILAKAITPILRRAYRV